MIHNNKVYANADQKFVHAVILYVTDGVHAYYDKDFTKPLKTKEEAIDLFLHNRIIVKVETAYYEIAGFSDENLYYLKKDGSFGSVASHDIEL